MTGGMRTAWLPESPDHPGLYATDPGVENGVTTICAQHARQFSTRDACQLWCDENPAPRFVPTEHCFYDE